MLRMESHHSDTSLNLFERGSPAWVKLWNASYNSTAVLNLGENEKKSERNILSSYTNVINRTCSGCSAKYGGGSDTDLTSAIGDKEVAAKAVAFVVHSTRKGIVPLCAGFANLLRNKKSLEDRIVQLTKENEALRLLNNERESLTGSTVTRSKQSEPLEGYPDESRDSIYSSLPTSPTTGNLKSELAERRPSRSRHGKQARDSISSFNHITSSPPEHSFVPVIPATQSSPRVDNEVLIHPIPSDDTQSPHTTITVAEVHVSSEPTTPEHRAAVVDWSRRACRTPSLSSSERGSDRSLELGAVEEKGSTSTIAKKLNRTVLINNKLTEELNAARATIEKLQREVRDLRVFCKNNNQDGADNGLFVLRQGSIPDVLPSQQRRTSLRIEGTAQANLLPSCQICAEARRAASVNGATMPRLLKHDAITLFTRDNMLVTIEDSVLTNSNQCGTVQYIGHLDGFAPTCLFVGLQLADRVTGGFDGSFDGKRYFSCPKGCGIFIRAQDIVNVITKKQASVFHKSKKPILASSYPDESVTSSSNGSSSGGFVRKLRRPAVNIRHTHSQKRISLPGDPNQPTEHRQSTKTASNQPTEERVNTNHRRSHSAEGELPEGIV